MKTVCDFRHVDRPQERGCFHARKAYKSQRQIEWHRSELLHAILEDNEQHFPCYSSDLSSKHSTSQREPRAHVGQAVPTCQDSSQGNGAPGNPSLDAANRKPCRVFSSRQKRWRQLSSSTLFTVDSFFNCCIGVSSNLLGTWFASFGSVTALQVWQCRYPKSFYSWVLRSYRFSTHRDKLFTEAGIQNKFWKFLF